MHPSSSPFSCRFSLIPNFTPVIIPRQLFSFSFLFLPLDLPICTLSVASFKFFSSSVPQPMFLVDSLSRIVLRSPKILLLFLIPLRSNIVLLLLPSLSHLFSCVPLCVFFSYSISFVHFLFIHLLFVPYLAGSSFLLLSYF
jgi:hypothetical protein